MGRIVSERPNKYLRQPRTQYLRGECITDWNPELIKIQMIDFNNRFEPFVVKKLGLYRKPVVDPALSKLIGKPSSRKFFHHVACHYFGTWELAMSASGLIPTKTAPNKFWTKELVVVAIQALSKSGHALTVKTIWRDRKGSTVKVLRHSIGKATTGSALHDAARRYYGSWDSALNASGLESEFIKEKPFWTKRKIVRAIQEVHKNDIALNTQEIGSDQSSQTAKIIKSALGKKRDGKSLHGGAYRIFGSWDRALIEANINPNTVRKVPFSWNRRSVSRLLNVLYEHEIPINSSSLMRDRSEQTNSVLFDYTGQKITTSKIFQLAKNDFGNWDNALKFSGFRLCEVRRSGSPCFKDDEKIIEIIRNLNRHEFALNRAALDKQSYRIKSFIEDHYGSAISGLSIFNAALLYYENWDEVLWQAGLDPSSIRLRSRSNTSNLSIIPHQKEDVKVDGDRRLSNFIGWSPKNPEEIMDEQQNSDNFWGAVDQLENDDQEITQKIFDAILNVHHYRDQNQLIKFISQDIGVDEDRILVLLNQFKGKFKNNLRH